MWFLGLLLATGSANILPIQVTNKSEKNTGMKNENRSSNLVFQYLIKRKDEKEK